MIETRTTDVKATPALKQDLFSATSRRSSIERLFEDAKPQTLSLISEESRLHRRCSVSEQRVVPAVLCGSLPRLSGELSLIEHRSGRDLLDSMVLWLPV